MAIRLAISRMASSSAGSWAGMVVSWVETTHNDLRLAVEGCLVELFRVSLTIYAGNSKSCGSAPQNSRFR